MYKIFINDKPLILSDDKEEYKEAEYSLFLNSQTKEEVLFGIEALQNQEKVESLFVCGDDLNLLWENFKSDYHYVECAGGIIKNQHAETLLIYKRDKWDLPKGSIETNEDAETAALREAQEECGLAGLHVTAPVGETYHTYSDGDENYLKKTSWFTMEYTGTDEPIPQSSEGITEAKWFSGDELDKPFENMYNSLKDLLDTIT